MWTFLSILLVSLLFIFIHSYKKKKKEIKPEIGQLWIKNQSNPFIEKKVAEITDIRNNSVGDVYVKVRYRFGDELRDGGYDDSWDFESFKFYYSLCYDKNGWKIMRTDEPIAKIVEVFL